MDWGLRMGLRRFAALHVGGLGAFGPRAPQIKREGEDRGGARGPAFADAVPPMQLRSTVVYKKCWMGVGPRRRPGVR